MGACSSCLSGRDSHDSESSRLLDEDLYQSGFNYGSLQPTQPPGPELETLKREREALEAICQRASDSVVDIWALQPHQTIPSAPPSAQSSARASRIPSSEATVTQATLKANSQTLEQFQPSQGPQSPSSQDLHRAISPVPGDFAGMRFVAYRKTDQPNIDLPGIPKHWGEVVMSTKKGKKPRTTTDTDQSSSNGDDVFGVLVVR
ncbi:hypothetical protein FQN57_002630 [Myotisia sp. PD_48]|nr:hypothetical protein FQN57_002630 [Myotisia sp. PD_48]